MIDTTSLLYSAFFGTSGPSGLLDVNPADLTNLAASRNVSTALGRELDADKVQISGLGQLLSAVSSFQGAVGALTIAAAVNPTQASSSDASVATAAATADAQTGTYDVVVSQLAAAQTVVSGTYADADTTVVGTGTLHIQLGTVSGSSFTAGSDPAADITITGGTLNGIAASINAADAGITASVVEIGGSYQLSITAADTGTTNAFEITVSDDDGTDNNNNGLSKLTFDHGSGNRLTQTQTAGDASYTINGVAATSAANTGVSVAPGVTLTLLKTGSTTVTVSQDVTNLEAAATALVDAYNTLVTAVGGLTGVAGALSEGGLGGDILDGAERILAESFSGAAPFTMLSGIGIAKEADGTLGLDSTTLQNAFNSDPDAATALLNQAATAFDDFAETFTRTGGIIANASQSLQQQVHFLENQSTGADFALSVQLSQATRQYAAILALSLDF